jgi:glycosyltransferase involved in cell wall biosynthesis
MSIYNGEKYFREAIDSILGQTFKYFEFLIFNDGSTDKTGEILESYNDPRIKIINNKKILS